MHHIHDGYNRAVLKGGFMAKMKVCLSVFIISMALFSLTAPNGWAVRDGGYDVTSSLWAKAVLQVATTPVTPVTLKWKLVGTDITPSGDQVISGYFYADPNDFAYGSQYNPEVFVKIYIAKNGWCNIAYNHVTVDNVTVSSALNYNGQPNKTGSVTLSSRLAEHQYNGVNIDHSLSASGMEIGSDSSLISPLASTATGGGYVINSGLWAKAVLQVATTPVTPVTLIWKEVGIDTTKTGARVVSGYFYADPATFAYGSEFNPEVFIKIYIDPNGWANIASNHVTVDDVIVSSSYQYNGTPSKTSTISLKSSGKRLAEHSYTGVIIESSQSVEEKVSSLMGTLTTSGDVLTPLTNELNAIIGAISDPTSTVPLTITPPVDQINLENPPATISVRLNYGNGYTATDGATMTGSLAINITGLTMSSTGISLNIAVSADQIKRNGVLVLDCDLNLSASLVPAANNQLAADLTLNIISMDTPAGSVSGQIVVDVPAVDISAGTFQPITISFDDFVTERLNITSGALVISSPSADNFQLAANLTTNEGTISGTLLLDMTDASQSVLNSTGDFQLEDYTLDVNALVFKPDVCSSYPVSGNVIIEYGAETHTMTFTGDCDSYQFQ
jgi:hypothetical protein